MYVDNQIIKNFRLLYSEEVNTSCLTSWIFYVGENNHKCWLRITKGCVENDDYISIYLVFVCSRYETQAKVKFAILNAKGEVYVPEGRCSWECQRNKQELGFERFIETDYLLNEVSGLLLPDGSLIISCEINFVTERVNISGQDLKFKIPECELLSNLGKLFEDQMLTDVTISVSGKEYQAHKAILAARSKVFATMFKCEMKENKSNRMEVTDVDHKVVGELLLFVYTGKVSNLKGMAGDLFSAADKYCLEKLKAMCEEELCKQLSIKNAADILVLADLHNCSQMKAATIKFINANKEKVIQTSGWKSLTETHQHLVTEAYQSLR